MPANYSLWLSACQPDILFYSFDIRKAITYNHGFEKTLFISLPVEDFPICRMMGNKAGRQPSGS
jgi:hypothetical protein